MARAPVTETQIKFAYAGCEFEFREDNDTWSAMIPGKTEGYGNQMTSKSLKELKRRVDKVMNPPVEFQRIEAYEYGRWDSDKPKPIIITSLDEERPDSVWTTGPDGRAKRDTQYLWARNEHNDEVFVRLRALCAQIRALEAQVKAERANLEPAIRK